MTVPQTPRDWAVPYYNTESTQLAVARGATERSGQASRQLVPCRHGHLGSWQTSPRPIWGQVPNCRVIYPTSSVERQETRGLSHNARLP